MLGPRTKSRTLFRPLLGILLLLVGITSSNAQASMLLAPGATVPLPGSTAAAEPDLAGIVIHDALIDFVIKNASGALLCRGQLQNRVVRSNPAPIARLMPFLHFYYRIRGVSSPATAALLGRIRRVETIRFAGFDPLRVDFRPDGLGSVPPRRAIRNALPGQLVVFDFQEPPLPCGVESRFFFIKTSALAFAPSGRTRIVLTTGESVVLETAAPAP